MTLPRHHLIIAWDTAEALLRQPFQPFLGFNRPSLYVECLTGEQAKACLRMLVHMLHTKTSPKDMEIYPG